LAQTLNDGTFAQDDFINKMTRPGRYVWRMRDKKDLMGLNRGRKVAAFALPSDFLVGEEGKVFFAEVKSTTGDRFDYSNVQPGQRSASGISAKIRAPYWFFIYSVKRGQWFRLSAEQFHEDIKTGKKSRRFDELEPFNFGE
jgi:hypothetical protein